MPHKLDTDTHVYFYEQEFYVLSNFAAFRLWWKGVDFDTAEHAYHWEKFHHTTLWGMADLQEAIRRARSAHEAFQLAQQNRHVVRADWSDVRVAVMRQILRAKVAQHEYVRRKLLETGDRKLIEDSWRDAFWGWGPEKNGLNTLGILWMEIRAELRHKDVALERSKEELCLEGH